MKKTILFVLITGSIMAGLAFIPKNTISKSNIEISKIDSKIISNPISQINQEIIGIWINEDDLSYKLEFLDNGVLKEYVNNQLVATLAYSISHSCETTSDPSFEFLKKIENDGSTYCYEINGINIDNSGILSIRSMENGKLYIFNRL